MIFDRLIYLTKWILYTIPEVLFAVLFHLCFKRDENVLAYPKFLLSANSFIVFSRFANNSEAAKAVKMEKER